MTTGPEDRTVPLDETASGSRSSGGPTSSVDVRQVLAERFRLEGELGRGAMGVVYAARELSSGRPVALKVAKGDLDDRRRARFAREGELTARLDHPGIVTIHAAGLAGGRPWLAYELIEGGETLEEVLRGAPLRRRVELLRDAARAVGAAHRAGVVHRDMKPENVLVDGEGRVRVADFGLAAAADVERLTQTGAMVGTPSFMAPEQYEGRREQIGPATDVWALGVMLYEALTDRLPFVGKNMLALGTAITEAKPEPPRTLRPEVPAALEALVLATLRYDPAERPPDGEAFAQELDAWLAGKPAQRRRPRRRRALGVGALALGVALALGWTLRPRPTPDADVASEAPVRLRRVQPEGAGELLALERRLRLVLEVEAPDGSRLRAGGRTHRLEEGPRHELELTLEPGLQELELALVLPDGAEGPRLSLSVRCLDAPAWLRALPEGERPPLPLPAGLSWGDLPGEYLNARDRSTLVWIPPGTFVMGQDDDAREHEPQGPAHEVTLTQGFFLGKREVSWFHYRNFCRETGHPLPAAGASEPREHPVWGVTWHDAAAYCAWAQGRLPTEAEWEWAARRPDGRRRWPWGETPPDERTANLRDLVTHDLYPELAPVGSFPLGASHDGCLDLIGNVYEWTADFRGPYPAAPQVDPRGPAEGIPAPEAELGRLRIMRGGAWNSGPFDARTRASAGEAWAARASGFRLARGPR